jgi:DNA-binding GntR family transcriptional regulator
MKPMMQTAADTAYAAIRQQIVSGELAAGALLNEQDLASAIGVSRTPVREALQRLQGEGLVRGFGSRRMAVREFSEEDVGECFELRTLLEGHAAARAATRITSAGLSRLKELAAAMDEIVAREGARAAPQFSELNDLYHAEILAQADSPMLRELLAPLLQVQLVLLRRYAHAIEWHLQRSCRHHRELIAAFEAGDPRWAEAQMRTHLLSARNPAGAPSD